MKKILSGTSAALVLIIILLSSCKKESSDNRYIKFKMDGNWVTWKAVSGHLVTNGVDGKSGFELISYSDAKTESFHFGITLDSKTFPTGTYTADNSFSVVTYMKDITAFDFINYSGGGTMGGDDTRYVITISSINDKEAKGSFTGTYLRNDEDDNDLLNITEGEFTVPLVR